jgi:hypothetical protein
MSRFPLHHSYKVSTRDSTNYPAVAAASEITLHIILYNRANIITGELHTPRKELLQLFRLTRKASTSMS